MNDWIDDRAAGLRQQRERAQEDGQLQLHRAQVVRDKGRPFLDALTQQVATDVAKYQQKFMGEVERSVDFNIKPSGGFKLYKSHYPAAAVKIELRDAEIVATYVFTPSSGRPTTRYDLRFPLEVDARDNITLRGLDGARLPDQGSVSSLTFAVRRQTPRKVL